jgi:hypothetical protein
MSYDLMKKVSGIYQTRIGLWSFMKMSKKIDWINDTIALVIFEVDVPMWLEMNITIWEGK